MCSRRRNAPSVPASLQRSASASNRRFSLPENLRRLAIATTSGSRRASSEAVSPVALRAPSAAASEEEPDNPFVEDFSNEVMVMSYLYSKLPETGVSPHIGTGGNDDWLFPGETCGHKEKISFSTQIVERIHKATGLRVTVHQFRHAAGAL